jgi:hypothetical protein
VGSTSPTSRTCRKRLSRDGSPVLSNRNRTPSWFSPTSTTSLVGSASILRRNKSESGSSPSIPSLTTNAPSTSSIRTARLKCLASLTASTRTSFCRNARSPSPRQPAAGCDRSSSCYVVSRRRRRVVADGRDPLQRSAVGGRRDDRTFDVLFTSTKADGAVPEMYFHLSKGNPVMPLLAQYRFFELEITLENCVRVTK